MVNVCLVSEFKRSEKINKSFIYQSKTTFICYKMLLKQFSE